MREFNNGLMRLKRIANYLVYASVVLGVFLLAQLYGVVPSWLFYSVLTAWIVYLATAILIARGSEVYPVALVLAVLTLGVSLPQPEHANMVEAGFSAGTLTLLAGSILQVGVIPTIVTYLILKRRIDRSTFAKR